MSFKSSLIKIAIKLTPEIFVIWIANFILKGIAELSEFIFDLDTRTAYVQLTLTGEAEPIDVSIDGFAIISEQDSHRLIIRHAQANKPWLNNLLSRITGRYWEIPSIPQYKAQIDLLAELFYEEAPSLEEE